MTGFCEVPQVTRKKKKRLQILSKEIVIKSQGDTEKYFEDKKVLEKQGKVKVTGPKQERGDMIIQ